MLKIKREGHKSSIRLSGRTSFGLSKALLIALALAVAYHLLFFFLVDTKGSVKDTPYREQKKVILSIEMNEAEEPASYIGERDALANHTLKDLTENTQPFLLPMSRSEAQADIFAEGSVHSVYDIFLRETAKKERTLPSRKRYYPPLKITLGGALSDRSLITLLNSSQGELHPYGAQARRYLFVFECVVESASGEIASLKHVSGSSDAHLQKKAEEAIGSLLFKSHTPIPLVKGLVEVVITEEKPLTIHP